MYQLHHEPVVKPAHAWEEGSALLSIILGACATCIKLLDLFMFIDLASTVIERMQKHEDECKPLTGRAKFQYRKLRFITCLMRLCAGLVIVLLIYLLLKVGNA